MPLTELWLSAVRSRRPPGSNGYDSPTSRSAAVALAVKTTSYSSGEALKNARMLARAASANRVEAADAGLSECGLPKTSRRSRRWCSSSCDCA